MQGSTRIHATNIARMRTVTIRDKRMYTSLPIYV